MKKNLSHLFARLWAFVLAFALLLSGCGTGADTTQDAGGSSESAGQGAEESAEPVGQDTEEGWKPTTSVNLIVPYAAGGGTDIMARAIAQYIDLDGQSMYITNIEGGASTIGAMEAYHADNDGLTLLLHTLEATAFSYVEGTLTENLCEEMVWIACLVEDPYAISVAAGSPYESMEDLIVAARANPGGLRLASNASSSQRGIVQGTERAIGVEFNFVPYDGGANSRAAVLGGHDDLVVHALSEAVPYATSGDLRILALASEARSELVPDVPTIKDLGYDGDFFSASRCFILPPNTNEEIARYYEGKLKEVFENEEFQSLMLDTHGINTAFTDMDGMKDKISKTMRIAEEFASSLEE